MDPMFNPVGPSKRPHSEAPQLELNIPSNAPDRQNAAISPPSHPIAQLPTSAASMNPEAKRSRVATSSRSSSDSAFVSTSQSEMEQDVSQSGSQVDEMSHDFPCKEDQEMESPESERSFKELLEDNEELLQRCLVVNDNLLLRLKRKKIVSKDIKNTIQSQPAADARITKLLEILDDVPDEVFEKFMSALRDDGQEHVANIFRRESDVLPMSDEHYEILKRETTCICQCLDIQEDLMDKLLNEKVFSDSDRNRVVEKTGREPRARKAIDILTHKSDSAFRTFISCLRSTNRQHVVTLLGETSDKIPMSEEHRKLLVKKTGEVAEFLDTKCGLLDHLVTDFTTFDMDSVNSREGPDEMSREVIDILLRKSDCVFDKFIQALLKTDQEHVAYILTEEGVPPMYPRCRKVIRNTRQELVDCIDAECSGLIDKLISGNVLNTADVQRLQHQPTNQAKNGVILDALVRKPQHAFEKFILALEDIGQKQVAKELVWRSIKGYIETRFKNGIGHQAQHEITNRLRDVLQRALVHGKEHDPRGEEINTIFNANGISLSDILNGSIRIRFRCSNKASLVYLRRLHDDQTLNRLFTDTFCPEFASEGLISLSIVISDAEFTRCAESFKRCSVMTRHHRQILQETAETFGDSIIVTDRLLEKLSLTIQRKKAIMAAEGKRERAKRLMDIMSRQTDSAFALLVNTLRDDQQNEVADFISGNAIIGDDDKMFACLFGESNAKQMSDIQSEFKRPEAAARRPCTFQIKKLPLELLEVILVLAYIKLLAKHNETRAASQLAFKTMAAVCYNWWQTMTGWPQSDTRNWFRHKLRRCVTGKHRQLLTMKKGELRKFLDPMGGLLEELLTAGIINNAEWRSVKNKLEYDEMALEIVEILLNKPPSTLNDTSFEKFVAALRKTGQRHVVFILTGEGEHRPLSELRRRILRKARYRLLSMVDSVHSSLIAQLISLDVLTEYDKQRIEAHRDNEHRMGILLDLIARKSHAAYDIFLQALKDSAYVQEARFLEGLELRGLLDCTFFGNTWESGRKKIVSIRRSNMEAIVAGKEHEIHRISELMEQSGFAVADISDG